LLQGRSVFEHNFLDLQHTRWEGGYTGEDPFTRPLMGRSAPVVE
jgi:hypothetical protein